ncbi:MAG: type VI secretion system contractile sheath large subunit [Acidobacteria bacterium]|nr:type VI secretion system contractile sheath large subunit [Acidobacteriota bacterium]
MPTSSTNTNNPLWTHLAEILQGEPEEIWIAIDQCLRVVNRSIEAQINEILHHPDFQALERMWMGLALLIDSVGDLPLVKLEMLQCTKEELADDFDQFMDLSDSGLFQHLYKTEYDQAGGEPYGSVLFHHFYDHRPLDTHLLKQISKVAAACHCPAITNAAFTLFGARNARQLEQVEDLDLLFQNPEYTKWRALRETEDARYLALALPQVLIRAPYSQRIAHGLVFTENLRSEEDLAWAPATFPIAIMLARSFSKHGWCVHIRGPHTGGLVEEITPPKWTMPGLDIIRPPIQLSFSDKQEHMFSNHGFLVLNYFKTRHRLCVFSAPTLQIFSRDVDHAFTSNDRLAASLPYVYLVSRIAHYQKVIQRENVGTVKESTQIENELRDWLQKLVTKMPDPSLEIRSRYPLRGGLVDVMEDPGNPGFFNVRMVIQPHLQLEGVNAELTLLSKLPRKKE